ncbi:hypothetical protein JCM30471_23440 [Desulfuromonas carbonis]
MKSRCGIGTLHLAHDSQKLRPIARSDTGNQESRDTARTGGQQHVPARRWRHKKIEVDMGIE